MRLPLKRKLIEPVSAPMFGRLADALESDWARKARANQLPPAGDWRVWLLLAGRGFGKTRTGAEWVRGLVEAGMAGRIALVAPTAADARDVIVEGESGILAISPPWNRPTYEPSKRRLTWPNGAQATTYSADEPERLRGPQHDAAWCDEIGAWRYAEAWDMLMFGLRLGKDPRCVATTTPKRTRLIRDLLRREGKDVVVTRGKTQENATNLAPAFLEQIVARYAGTRLGRQELDAEMLEDTPGALWTRDVIERCRCSGAPALSRIVVAIDPAATSGEQADETGIVVCGIDSEGRAYVLDDLSGRYQPTDWARIAITAYHQRKADRIVAETNNGGEMVEATLRSVDPSVSFKAVHASRGKATRAEPISALYEQNRVHHCGAFPALEDQMCAFATGFDRAAAGFSPDRVDALVWALSELVLGQTAQGYADFYALMAAEQKAGRPIVGVNIVEQAKAAQPKPTVTLRAPRPWMNFAPGRGKRYCSDSDCLITAVESDDVEPLVKSGCVITH